MPLGTPRATPCEKTFIAIVAPRGKAAVACLLFKLNYTHSHSVPSLSLSSDNDFEFTLEFDFNLILNDHM